MYGAMRAGLRAELDEIRAAGLFKAERIISTPQIAGMSRMKNGVIHSRPPVMS